MKKRLLAMLMVLMLVVSLLPVGALAAGTAEVIGGQYEGDLTVEYRIEISQLYKLIMLNAYDVNDDTKLEGATIHFHERRGYGDSQNLLPNTAVDRANFYYYYSFSNVSDAGDPYNISGLTIKYDGKEVYINASDLRIRYDGSHTYFVESRNDEKNIVIFYDNGEATSVTKGDYWVYAVRLIDNGATVTNWPDEPETITYPFINWTYNPDGTGGVFLSNSKVNNDTEVFARKVSGDDTTAGILIHVMNDNNALLERFVELYNAKYSDSITTADINDAVLDSMKITVHGSDGSSTNPNYYVSAFDHNGWEDGYYKIYNRDGDSLNPSSPLYNKHIPIGEISSITIEAKIGENTVNVDISRGSNPGDFEAATSALDRIIILTINAPPEKPSDDDLDVDPDEPGDTGLLESAVKVTCTNTDAEHNAQTFDLLPDSFIIGDVVYTTEGYTCTVTVNAGAYVTAYSNSTENGTHELAEGESDTKTIKLVYSDNSWTVPTGATPVNFNVTCDAEGPEEPTDPEKPGEADLGKLSVTLDCVTANVEHKDGMFKLESSNCTVDDVVASTEGVYTCVVTPDYALILAAYNKNVGVTHTYTDNTAPVFTLTWNADTQEWVADNTSITRNVQCKSTELPDDYVAEYHVMNLYGELDIIAEKWEHEDYIGFYLNNNTGDFLGRPNEELSQDNGWNDDRTYYTVNNGTYGSDDYMPYTEVDGLHFYYAITPGAAFTYRDIDILVTEPDENHVSKIYVLFDIHLYNDYNNGYWYDADGDGEKEHWATTSQGFVSGNDRWKAGSEIALDDTLVNTQGKKYYEPIHADVNGRDVVFLGWDVENHETIYEPGDEPTNLITDKFSITEDVLRNCNITPLEVCLYGVYGYAEPDVTDYTVTIAPADIIAYTGGTSYSVIVNGSGAEIGTTTSGLPVPGYHIELSRDVQEWLGTATGQQLDDVITFTYNHDGETRTWNLSYVGVYSTDAQGQPETYVYELESTGDSPEVRLQFTDENGDVFYSNDDIPMTEQTVNAKYSMTIYGGLLDQNYVEAQIKRPDGETITADVIIGTGTLTVLSTTNEEYTTDLNADSGSQITADVNDDTTFTVNDSAVTLDPDDVKLLVDSVSNNDDFNAAIEDDARDHVNMSNAGTESFYLDLVHADNGNVQVGLDGSLTISWPMPDDADPDGEFTIVHYVDMDRSAVMGEDALATADKEKKSVTANGDQLIFDVDSFSPFVLVYETDDGYEPVIPTPDPDDDTEYVPKWLNTEDHFAYIVGYEDGEVKPNNNITRAEVATIFFRLLTDDARARYWSQTNDYTDVAADSWYNNAISTLSNMGIINGYEDGTFQPNASITRAEFTAIATRFFDYTAEYDGAFNDVSRSAWYADCVQAAVDMGLVDGYPDGGFHPNSNITRAEAVTIVNRVLNRAPHEDHLLDEDEMNVWPDNVYGAWYYADMQEATNSHDYDWIRVSGERVEEWTEKLPERDWAALEQEWSSAYSG